MTDFLDQYQLTITEDDIQFLLKSKVYFDEINKSYLLKAKNEDFCILEKIVYDIATFHLSNKNIAFDTENHFVEFAVNTKGDNQFKIGLTNAHEIGPIHPIFSSITYLTEPEPANKNEHMVFTDLTNEKYIYKEFAQDIRLFLSFPKKLNEIVFDSSDNYYSSNLIDSISLSIHIWDKFPFEITYFDPIIYNFLMYSESKDEIYNDNCKWYKKTDEPIVAIKSNKESISTIEMSDVITDTFLEEIIYENKICNYEKLTSFIDASNNPSIILFKRLYNTEPITIDTPQPKRIDISEPRFLQRPIIKSKLQIEVCNWIVSECERHALNIKMWEEKKEYKYLQIEEMQTIFSYVLDSFNSTIENISDMYSVCKDKHTFIIEDMFIKKYVIDASSNPIDPDDLFYEENDCDIVLNILLNDDFEGGSKSFSDGINTYLKKGDMILYNGNVNTREVMITSGIKYILVAYINVFAQ